MSNKIWDRITNIMIGWGAGIFMAVSMDAWAKTTWGWHVGLIVMAIAWGYLLVMTILDRKPLGGKPRTSGGED